MTVAYKQTPYESPARFGPNGTEPQPDLVRSVERPAPPMPEPPPQRRRKAPEPLTSDSTAKLIEAANRVRVAIDEQINYHEEQLRRLRAALVPFQQSDAGNGVMSAEEFVSELAKMAEGLPKGEQK